MRSLRITCLKKRADFSAGLYSAAFLALCFLSPISNADIYSASAALSDGDYETAAKEFTRLAEAGNDKAQAHLGYLYYAGEGVEQSYEKAVEWYRKAATQGNRDAQYNLAVSYAFGEGNRQDLTEAAVWYRRAAEQGHTVSQYSLAISYAYGEGVPQDLEEAARWFEMAAEQGYTRAQVHLGSIYHTGEGVEQDYKEAARWYRMAADRGGDATAQYNLGKMYRSGRGVEQDYAQAKRWFRLSANQGYAAARDELSSLERSAAATITTRTIQTKPSLSDNNDNQSIQQLIAQPATKQPTPEKTANISETTIDKTDTLASEEAAPKQEGFFSRIGRLFSSEDSATSVTDSNPGLTAETDEPETVSELSTSDVESVAMLDEEDKSDAEASTVDNVNESIDAAGKTIANKTAAVGNTEDIPVKEEVMPPGGRSSAAIQESLSPVIDVDTIETEENVAADESVTLPVVESDVAATSAIYDSEEVRLEAAETESSATKDGRQSGVFTQLDSLSGGADERQTGSDDKGLALAETSKKDAEVSHDEPAAVGDSVETLADKTAKTDDSKPETTVNQSKDRISVIETNIEESSNTITAPSSDTVEPVIQVTEEAPATKTNIDRETINDAEFETQEEEKEEEKKGFFSSIGEFFSDDMNVNVVGEEPIVTTKVDKSPAVENELARYSIAKGQQAILNEDYSEAAKQFIPLAEAGNSEAQSYLGSLYYVGNGVEQDLSKSYEWYRKAAEQGNRDAQYSIGNMYLLGQGVEQNNAEAAKWYSMASEQGHIAASYNLENLQKLEALNQKNAMRQAEIEAAQQAQTLTESNPEEIEISEESTAAIENNNDEDNIEAILTDEDNDVGTDGEIETEDDDEIVVEAEAGNDPETIVAESSTDSEISTPTSDETESVELAAADVEAQRQGNSEAISSGFFDSLSGNNESEPAALKTTDQLPEPRDELPQADDLAEQTGDVLDIQLVEKDSSVDNVANTEPAENNSLNEGPEEKTGIAGFLGRLFSGDEETPEPEDTPIINENEQLAMMETSRLESDESNVVDDEIITSDLSNIDAVNTAEADLKAQAIQGDAEAQYQVGAQYYAGDNSKQDFAQAALWYRRAAQQGNADAQYSLGNMFLLGEGVDDDSSQAAYWYALAAEQGHVSASANLENLNKTIPPVAVSTDTNTDRLMLIDNQENMVDMAASATGQSEYETGLAYAFGDGVPQNNRMAFNYFLKAAEKGYALAQYKAGVAYAYGEGVRQDYKSAADWYRKAAEQGHTIAQRNLATMYLNGNGIQKDKVQALAWYQVVAANGNAMDVHRRDMLQNKLSELELSQSETLAGEITSRLNNAPSL